MQAFGIAVDLTNTIDAAKWQAQTTGKTYAVPMTFTDYKTALSQVETAKAVVLVIFAKEVSPELSELLGSYKRNVGAIPGFQAIVNTEPSPAFMSSVFEFGIENYLSDENWHTDLDQFTGACAEILNNDQSTEVKAIQLTRAIKSADQEKIKTLASEMSETAKHDYLAAFSQGKALEATGNFDQAVEVLKSSTKMNKLFRSSSTSLGENLLITGRVDEAIEIFEKLDKTNPNDVGRKATLATAFDAKGDKAKAEQYAQAAEKLNPNDSRVREAKAQLLLTAGKIGEAFKMMDGITNAGPFFASKLNEMGIKLSQAGQGKSALALYEKAHKVVRPELRFKISLNAALACHRLNAFKMALQYLDKCQKEYGGSFEKLEKIRRVIQKNLETAAKPAA